MVTSVGIVFRSKAEQKVADAGYDPARLPPGQYLTQKWPVLHAGDVPETDLATWDFRVFGEVENEIALSWDELQALPATEITLDIHCVTRWSRFDTSFRGVSWATMAEVVKPNITGGSSITCSRTSSARPSPANDAAYSRARSEAGERSTRQRKRRKRT